MYYGNIKLCESKLTSTPGEKGSHCQLTILPFYSVIGTSLKKKKNCQVTLYAVNVTL